jgi:CelD/BcsL family acetyltransferase involved in cellulose biosynthesis
MTHQAVPIETTSTFDYSIEQVSSLYEAVFGEQQPSNFFLSFEWISNWLLCANNKPELIRFVAQGKIIGFVFVGIVNTKLGKVVYLNQCGNKDDDQIWIEYNDVICIQNHQCCRTALLNFLASKSSSFQFVGINTIAEQWQTKHWSPWSTKPTKGFSVQLGKEPSHAHFSKNTKSQISRSRSFIELEYGELETHWLNESDIDTALKEMAKLHINQWGNHDYGSGFTNKRFVDFHKQLLLQGMGDFSHIAKFTAGDHKLGYLYFFTREQKVYFYLSAINYQNKNNKYKPGLVMHKLALAHFQSLGYTEYDFLAGQARYKTSLSNQDYLLFNVKLYMNKWYYWPIKQLVNVKRWVNRLSSQNK